MGLKIKLGQRQQVIPPGEYNAKVVEICEKPFINKRRGLEFHFEIADGPHAGKILRAFVNSHYETFSEYTKLFQWASVVSKFDCRPDVELDLDLFLEKVLRVRVETKKSRKTQNEFSNVTGILGVVCDLG